MINPKPTRFVNYIYKPKFGRKTVEEVTRDMLNFKKKVYEDKYKKVEPTPNSKPNKPKGSFVNSLLNLNKHKD